MQLPEFSDLENKLHLDFLDKNLLRQAFTHRSFINESKNTVFEHNERLEFLGDAVLGTIVANFLFSKFPFKDEGFLTELRSRMVSRVYLI